MATAPVAFSAYASTTSDYDSGAIVQFDSIVTNIGDSFDHELSVFQCPADGIYLFSISLQTPEGISMFANIVKEGSVLLSSFSEHHTDVQSSVVVVTECQNSERVWVECNGNDRQLIGGQRSSFSGILITQYS